MIKVREIDRRYGGSYPTRLDDEINTFLQREEITREALIDIKFVLEGEYATAYVIYESEGW